MELVRDLCHSFDRAAFLEGHLSPVLFGSALRNFGVRDLLDTLIAHAPPPRDQQARQRVVHAIEPKMSGIVFKIQANMDPNHRDRIAFMRLASGKLTRGMRVKIVRTGKTLALNKRNDLYKLWRDDERVTPWKNTAYGVVQAFNTWNHHYASVRGGVSRELRNMENVINGKTAKSDNLIIKQLEAVL